MHTHDFHKKIVPIIIFLGLVANSLHGQDYPLHGHLQNIDEENVYFGAYNTLQRPVTGVENSLYDSLLFTNLKKTGMTGFKRKLSHEHLIILQNDKHALVIDPVIDFRINYTQFSDNNYSGYQNTRGYNVFGKLGSRIFFSSAFMENQAIMPLNTTNLYNDMGIIQGYGRVKTLASPNGFDFANSFGNVSLKICQQLFFTLGYDRLFIGDGYRSMILSDFAAPMTYAKLNFRSNNGKCEFTSLFSKALNPNFNNVMNMPSTTDVNSRYPEKFISYNIVTVNLKKHWQLSVVEALMMSKSIDQWKYFAYMLTPFVRHTYINYKRNLTNAFLAFNVTYQHKKAGIFYMQSIVDQILTSRRPAWGMQVGYKTFDLATVDKLYFQVEYDYANRNLYSFQNNELHYGHYNQFLANPNGNNFHEVIVIAAYPLKRFEAVAKCNIVNYVEGRNNSRAAVFDAYCGPLYKYPKSHIYNDLQLIFNVNRSLKLQIFGGFSSKIFFMEAGKQHYNFIYFGLRTAIRGTFYDY